MALELPEQMKLALKLKYQAQIAEAGTNLNNYLKNSVGVAEHPNIVGEANQLILKISEAKGALETLEELS